MPRAAFYEFYFQTGEDERIILHQNLYREISEGDLTDEFFNNRKTTDAGGNLAACIGRYASLEEIGTASSRKNICPIYVRKS